MLETFAKLFASTALTVEGHIEEQEGTLQTIHMYNFLYS